MKGLSLRYKLLAALTVFPLIGLSIFLYLAIDIFEKDKVAYVFESSLSVSKTRGARVAAEISSIRSIAHGVVLNYWPEAKAIAESGIYYFDREPRFNNLLIYEISQESGRYVRVIDLKKSSDPTVESQIAAAVPSMMVQVREAETVIDGIPSVPGKMLLAARYGDVGDPKHLVAVVLFEASDLASVFNERGTYRGFLVRKFDSQPVFHERQDEVSKTAQEIWRELANRKTPEGIAELKLANGKTVLASFAEVGFGDLVAVSTVDRDSALSAVDFFLKKSRLLFVAILSFLTIIAVLAARQLTMALRRLSLATRKVAEGDFAVRVDISSGGEIGLLATSFNAMASEVSRLMNETAEKARMESELATARAVQETLFPETRAVLGPIQISGHYEPASECGGDWWHYFENGDKVYLWIGDATGHGAPAALLTSAARAVASVIQFGPARSVSESLGILNRAIYDTSKGSMMMTFFLACVDKNTGEMSYANSSHEPPYLISADKLSSAELNRDDFFPLNQVNNPRLGESAQIEFKETRLQLKAGDRLILYTDGLVDAMNPDGRAWGERRFLKALADELRAKGESDQALTKVIEKLHEFRSGHPLNDDVTLMICSFRYEKLGEVAA